MATANALSVPFAALLIAPNEYQIINRILNDQQKSAQYGWFAVIAAMAFMQALDATILNTALPAIAHSSNRSPLAMQSAIISYTLTVAMLTW